jgi:hypothetical protein
LVPFTTRCRHSKRKGGLPSPTIRSLLCGIDESLMFPARVRVPWPWEVEVWQCARQHYPCDLFLLYTQANYDMYYYYWKQKLFHLEANSILYRKQMMIEANICFIRSKNYFILEANYMLLWKQCWRSIMFVMLEANNFFYF